MHPLQIKNEGRRANDGVIFFGQNKFDEKGRQINDFCLEYNQPAMASQNKGILKDKKKRLGLNQCPDRLRGRHCKLFYDIDSN